MNIREAILKTVEDRIENIFLDYQNLLNIQSGDIAPWDALALDEATEKVADIIAVVLSKQPRKVLEQGYIKDMDVTVIWEYVYADGELTSEKIVGFYHGEPSEENLKTYAYTGTECIMPKGGKHGN